MMILRRPFLLVFFPILTEFSHASHDDTPWNSGLHHQENFDDDELHRSYVCADYLHATTITLPQNTSLDFIQADVSCRDSAYAETRPVVNNDTAAAQHAAASPITTTTTALVNTSDLPFVLEAQATAPVRKRNGDSATNIYRVPSTIHFHLYAVSSDLELRYSTYPPGFAIPFLGPLPPPLVPSSAVLDFTTSEQQQANSGAPPEVVGVDATVDSEEDRALRFDKGLSFIYNASVPVNTTHATIELWIPTQYFAPLSKTTQLGNEQPILLGPRFDHSWSVDLTMNPRTTVRFDANEAYFNVSNVTPPQQAFLYNGGAGTTLVLNYTAPQTSLNLVDETLDGHVYVQQNLWDPNKDFVGASNSAQSSRQAFDSPTTTIATFGSNTLATIVRGVYQDNYTKTAGADDNNDFATEIALNGFQQKVTIAGIGDENGDSIGVRGLAVDLFTTADCNDVQGFQILFEIEDSVFYDPNHFLFEDNVEAWTARRARHINYCYEFTMEEYRSMEQIPGLPRTVDRVAFFGNVTARGPSADSTNIVNTTVNTTRESEFASTAVPLGPFVRPLPCLSDAELHNVECVYSGAAHLYATTVFASFVASMLTASMFALV